MMDYMYDPDISEITQENIINKNMQWRLCDCKLDKGYCLCKIETDEENKKVVD